MVATSSSSEDESDSTESEEVQPLIGEDETEIIEEDEVTEPVQTSFEVGDIISIGDKTVVVAGLGNN